MVNRKQNNNNEDQNLISRYQQGDLHAFDLLLTKYYQTIYQSFIYKGVSEYDASDFTQILSIRLFRVLQEFELKKSFKSYLKRAIQNMFYDYLKRKLGPTANRLPLYLKIHNHEDGNEKILLDVIENKVTPNPEQYVEEQELIGIIKSCTALIEPPYRKTLVCLWLDGYKRKIMAQLLEIPFGTVHSSLEAGKKQLRECVSQHYINEEVSNDFS